MTVNRGAHAGERRVLVTGATGLLGRALVTSLLASGVPVRVLTRGTRPLPADWGDRVEVRAGDLTRAETLAAALDGCGAVQHLAGELRDEARVEAVNTAGTRHLLEAAGRAGIEHVVHMSSVGVMGIEAPGVADEDSDGAPRSPYERSKKAAEEVVAEWTARTGVPVTVLRPTIVFGAREGSGPDSFLALLRAIASGRFMFVGRSAVANYVYVEDVAAAARLAGERRARGTFIVADPAPLDAFVAAAAEALGVAAPRRRLPRPVAFGMAAALEAAGAILGRPAPLTRARVRALATGTRFQSSRIHELGWAPRVGYPEGLRRTVAAYRAAGKLPSP